MTKEKKAFMANPCKSTLDALLFGKPKGYGIHRKRQLQRFASVRPLEKWEQVMVDLIPDTPRFKSVAASANMGYCPEWC